MKKRNLKKLSLQKNAISNLNTMTAGLNVTIVEKSEKLPCGSAGPIICKTEPGYGHPCTWEICVYIL